MTEMTKGQLIGPYLAAPTVNGEASQGLLPRRGGPKGLLTSTWLDRTLRVQYVDAHGDGQESSGVLLDYFPVGPVLSIAGGKTLIVWDRLVLAELVED